VVSEMSSFSHFWDGIVFVFAECRLGITSLLLLFLCVSASSLIWEYMLGCYDGNAAPVVVGSGLWELIRRTCSVCILSFN
jgi:hypothetical protein